MTSHRKSVALKNLSIRIGELEINEQDRKGLVELVTTVIEITAKGLLADHFWEKVNFIKTLILRIKENN